MKKHSKNHSASLAAGKAAGQTGRRRLLMAAVFFIPCFLLYEIGIWLEWRPIFHIYVWGAAALVPVFFFLTRGQGKIGSPPAEAPVTPEALREEKRRKAAVAVLLLLIALLLTLTLDFIGLFLTQNNILVLD